MSRCRVFAFVWLFVIFLAENALHFMFPHNAPPLLISGVVFYALLEGSLFGLVIGCYAGFFMDLFGIGKIGYEMALLGSIGCLSGFVASQIFRESALTESGLPVLGAYLAAVFNLFIFKTVVGTDGLTFSIFQEAFAWPQLALMALLSPLVFRFLKKVSFARPKRIVKW